MYFLFLLVILKKIKIRNKVMIPPRKIKSSPAKDVINKDTSESNTFKATLYHPKQVNINEHY